MVGGKHEAESLTDPVGASWSLDVSSIRLASIDFRRHGTWSFWQPLATARNNCNFAPGCRPSVFRCNVARTWCGFLLDDCKNQSVWTVDLYSGGRGSSWSGCQNLRASHLRQRWNCRDDPDRHRVRNPNLDDYS